MSSWWSGRASRCPKASTPDAHSSPFILSAPRGFGKKEDSPSHPALVPSTSTVLRGVAVIAGTSVGCDCGQRPCCLASTEQGPARETESVLQSTPSPAAAWLRPLSHPHLMWWLLRLPHNPAQTRLRRWGRLSMTPPPHVNRFRLFL